MCADEPYINSAEIVSDVNDETITVSLDVEHDPVIV
jgi:hypothetical protein